MAFEVKNSSTEVTGFVKKYYTGIGEFHPVMVNPTAEELAKYYGQDKPGDKIDYLKKNDKNVDVLTIAIFLKNEELDFTIPIKFRLINQLFVSEKNGAKKLKVIDSRGKTAWVTEDEFREKRIPVYKSGPADILADYRPSYKGEEEITLFIRALFNLKKDQPGTLEKIATIADKSMPLVKEIRDAIKLADDNTIKCCIGVGTYDNKPYNKVFNQYFMRGWETDVQWMMGRVLSQQQSGYETDVNYSFEDLHEYKVEPTGYKPSTTDAEAKAEPYNPFGGSEDKKEKPVKADDPFATPATTENESSEANDDLPF